MRAPEFRDCAGTSQLRPAASSARVSVSLALFVFSFVAGALRGKSVQGHKFRYFTLKPRVIVQTLEGPQVAKPGDWFM